MADHAHNLRASFRDERRPIGVITRGTTGTNRLRKSDRWMNHHLLRNTWPQLQQPLAIDLGYGASYTTTVEWGRWLRALNPSTRVLGLEIHPERVLPPQGGVEFALGGFELAGHHPHLVRAFNVLRQYDVDQVQAAWATVTSRLQPGGLFVEGTCDELGRRCCWITLDATGPKWVTFAFDPFDVNQPSDIAERLPKVLIHLNTPGNRIHDLLQELDRAWDRNAAFAAYGPRERWFASLRTLEQAGLPMQRARRRIQDCVLTVPWDVVRP